MIVDDEEAARYGMRRALTTLGYNITEAGSAEAARALLKQTEPDLVLLDVNLPGMSGLGFPARDQKREWKRSARDYRHRPRL
jgi:CheY-like chemotaxis protein